MLLLKETLLDFLTTVVIQIANLKNGRAFLYNCTSEASPFYLFSLLSFTSTVK